MRNFESIKTILNNDTHTYSFSQGINPKKIYSASQLVIKESTFPDKYKVYGKVALSLGSGTHYALEHIVKDYVANKDILMLNKICEKYKKNNYMFTGILEQVLPLIEKQTNLKTEITGAVLREDNVAFCGAADLIINDKILVDYKTIVGKPIIASSFHAVLEKLFYDKNSFYLDTMEEPLREQINNYIHQMGLYLFIFNLEEVFLLTPDEKVHINKEESELLKQYIVTFISELE